MNTIVRRLAPYATGEQPDISHEWLVTNGLGGYASATVSGIITRRYHGLLIAALRAPVGRMVMLTQVRARVRLADGRLVHLDQERLTPTGAGQERRASIEFRLESGLPVWRYESDALVLEKRVLMPHLQNTVYVTYYLLKSPGRVTVELQPLLNFRHHESAVSETVSGPYTLTAIEDRFEISSASDQPSLRLRAHGSRSALTLAQRHFSNLFYTEEKNRGYPHVGAVWTPGYFHFDLDPAKADAVEGTLVASTESWSTLGALTPNQALEAETLRRLQLLGRACPAAQSGMSAELVLAADQFIMIPAGRIEEAARAKAAGDEVRSIVAGYHWFTDWGRDTMISLEGLTLVTGRVREAAYVLRTFASYVRDGLIPNMFPEGERQGLYHTADATLWFFHALDRYLQVTGDRATLTLLLPVLRDIVDHHVRGTRFGIGVDPADGLLSQGAEGYQLTWMDAKVDDWVVTPRRGKAVEINALFYNALRLLEGWVRIDQGDDAARSFGEQADRLRASFNARFWYEDGGYLYDVVDGEAGNDTACRPNQILAVSLSHTVLDSHHWKAVVEVVRSRLLTPVGLRSLAPDDKDYKPQYYGDLRARDAAYHQGTVWAWLVGPFVDAWLKVFPHEREVVRQALSGFERHLNEACIGSISEIFDAEAPFTPRGCVAQAWSVAEVLRALVRTAAPD
jgi:predicted glycogen debranching enzyme